VTAIIRRHPVPESAPEGCRYINPGATSKADGRAAADFHVEGDQHACAVLRCPCAAAGGFCRRLSALDAAAIEEIVQQTMVNAIRRLASFRGGSTLFTWLCQICRNQLSDARRKSARQPEFRSFEVLSAATPAATVVELIDFRDPLEECAMDSTRSAVRRAVNELPARHARILELRYGDELTLAEIARAMQLSESAAESLLLRARGAFHERWRQSDTAPGEASPPALMDNPHEQS
jgi:RNA polymerase sigma-70 factor (ECF subfamily)